MLKFKIDWRGDNTIKETAIGASEGLKDAAEFLLDEANKLVPTDEGTLANSGNTVVDSLQSAVYYDTPYAIRQHEDTTLTHKNGRQSKYLETPFKRYESKLQKIIAAAIQDKLE